MKKCLILIMVLTVWMITTAAYADDSHTAEQEIVVFMNNERIFFNELPLIDEGTALVQFRTAAGFRRNSEFENGTIIFLERLPGSIRPSTMLPKLMERA